MSGSTVYTAKRADKSPADDMLEAAVRAGKGSVVAWSIVAFNEDGQSFRAFDTGGAMPLWAFPEAVKAALDQSTDNTPEDYSFRERPIKWERAKG